MVLILTAVIGVMIGVIYLARRLEPRQRVVLVVVFALALAYVLQRVMELGILGRRTTRAPVSCPCPVVSLPHHSRLEDRESF